MTYELIAVGASWGGLHAFGDLLEALPDEVRLPVVLAQHRSPDSQPGGLERLLQLHTDRAVREATDKQPLAPYAVYVAPPDYHLLVEPGALALSLDERVQYARPSIDVLFESAADAYGDRAVGIVLTGASADGAAGLARIKERGGVALVQDPATAERATMPAAAVAATNADAVLPVDEMGAFLLGLCAESGSERARRPA
jgi:two-component system, chemotaxis family, protein-glutamate methylesterase/glutaminase